METSDDDVDNTPSDATLVQKSSNGETLPPYDQEEEGHFDVTTSDKLREQFRSLIFGGPNIEINLLEISKHINESQEEDTFGDGTREKKKRDFSSEWERIRAFDKKPKQIRDYLDRFVIKQEEAKKVLSVAVCDHYNHIRRCMEDPEERERDYGKPNILLLGPTGVGKTYLIRNIAKLLGVPFVKADATKFSETGYVGNDVEDLVRDLVRVAGGSAEMAQYGIIFIDEIDKIATICEGGKDVSGRGVQINLLKLMEDTEVTLVAPHDIAAQMNMMINMGRKKTKRDTVQTRHILFIVSGAFDRLNDIICKRIDANAIGFGHPGKSETKEYLNRVTTDDLIRYGLEPEFVGRLPVRVACESLEKEDLAKILRTSQGSILFQYKHDFEGYGIRLHVTEEAIDEIAARAVKEKTGARGLMTILESLLRDFKFYLPSTNIRDLWVTQETVENPRKALVELIGDCGNLFSST
ncbi:MAG: AAA family ATPase [Puniceicoccales bacterium]|jgi:endopeptidase Clp ATP-binding regulatory subunit ClpX|nr:AAA family ATPase [Puniceicoccales bacterium]